MLIPGHNGMWPQKCWKGASVQIVYASPRDVPGVLGLCKRERSLIASRQDLSCGRGVLCRQGRPRMGVAPTRHSYPGYASLGLFPSDRKRGVEGACGQMGGICLRADEGSGRRFSGSPSGLAYLFPVPGRYGRPWRGLGPRRRWLALDLTFDDRRYSRCSLRLLRLWLFLRPPHLRNGAEHQTPTDRPTRLRASHHHILRHFPHGHLHQARWNRFVGYTNPLCLMLRRCCVQECRSMPRQSITSSGLSSWRTR